MKRILYHSIVFTLLLLSAGCAANYRQILDEYNHTQTTPYYQKTMDWVKSATNEIIAPPKEINTISLSTIDSATDGQSKFLTLVSELLNEEAKIAQNQIANLSPLDVMERNVSKQLEWPALGLATAIYNPAVIAAGERWKATLSQYDQASYLEGLIAEFRTFTRYLKVDAGKPLNKQMLQSYFPYPSAIALNGEMVKEQVRLAELEWQRTMRDKSVEAGLLYYELQFLARAESTTEENITLVANLLKVVEDRNAAGLAHQADIIKTQTELERQRNMLKDFQSKQRTAMAQINSLLGRDSQKPLGTPANRDEKSIKITHSQLMETAQSQRQEILGQQSIIARTSIAIRMGEVMDRPPVSQNYSLLERGMMPDASVEASAEPFGLMKKTNDRPAYAQAESYLAEMRMRLDAERTMLNQIVKETESLARSSLEELDAALRQVSLIDNIVLPLNRSTYDNMLGYYQSGSATFLDLLDAERELIRARLESHIAHRDLNQAILRLTTAAGKYMQLP